MTKKKVHRVTIISVYDVTEKYTEKKATSPDIREKNTIKGSIIITIVAI